MQARAADQHRRLQRRQQHVAKSIRRGGRRLAAGTRVAATYVDDVRQHRQLDAARGQRYWEWVRTETWDRLARDASGRRQLRRSTRGAGPIIVGPWLSEVGYEVLYWIPFLRWYCHRYRIDRQRVIAVSRGGADGWYAPFAATYVDVLELFSPAEFAALNAARHQGGDQKQHVMSSFDEQILASIRARAGAQAAAVCHPSTMFRLLREFWLGNESLQYLQRYTDQALVPSPVAPPALPLPERYVAIKFYSGRALPASTGNRAAVRALVERLAAETPVVTLDTGVALDEHEDYSFRDVPGVISAAQWMTPRTNLGLQTELIRRANLFVGTCGGLAWLAPMLGTPTVAAFSDDHFLSPHLYAARQAFASTGAAPFACLDLRLLSADGLGASWLDRAWTR